MVVSSFACRIKGDSHETTVHALTPGQAKSEYFRNVADVLPDLRFTDVRCRRLGGPIHSDNFLRTAKYRGVPFARIGMRVLVGGEQGVIVGHNSSANFDVLFARGTRYADQVLNCHPRSEVRYFAAAGNELFPIDH